MKNLLSKLALGLSLIGSLTAVSQERRLQPCDTYNAMEVYFKENPEAKIKFDQTQNLIDDYSNAINQTQAKTSSVPQFTIPVVFHILHTGGGENVSDAVINNALAQVNRDYARAGADTASIAAPFRAIYHDINIKFVLAKKDPNGNCTTGINHIYDTRTVWDRNQPNANSILFNGITWTSPTLKYLNIIIVKDIVAGSGQQGTVVGYTFLPGTWPINAPQDAIVYNYGYLNGLDARSLSHEIGHWLNLIHTFGNTNNPGVTCGDDAVTDTPPTKGDFSTCPGSLSGNTCSGSGGLTNVENIMNYSSCPKNFTDGQASRMTTLLNNPANIVGRYALWQTANLVGTDVNGTQPCAPKAEFASQFGTYTVCSGSSLSMRDFSFNGTISNYNWSTNSAGAIIASPNASNTNITFNTVGTVNVSLTVSNSSGSSTKMRQVFVRNGAPGITSPTFESFEVDTVPQGWLVTNPNNNSSRWVQTDLAAYDGIHSFYIDGLNAGANQTDILETPVIDIASNTNKAFLIAVAYAQSSATYTDQLFIDGSNDCGGTWKNIATLSAAQMRTNSGGITSMAWFPQFTSDWKIYDIGAYPVWTSDFISAPSAKIRFRFLESAPGNGNNIFIDAINLFNASSGVGINELTKLHKFSVYPNPTNAETNVRFNMSDEASVKLSVNDILGKPVETLVQSNLKSGEHNFTINKNNTLSKGIYFVNLEVNGARMTQKLVIN